MIRDALMTINTSSAPDSGNANARIGVPMAWGLSVGAAVGGLYAGWNLGLGQAGFGGMLVATLVAGALYLFLVMSVSELVSVMPYAGGTMSYSLVVFGRFGGFIAAMAVLVAYLCAMSSILLGVTQEIVKFPEGFGLSHLSAPLVWAALLLLFGWLNVSSRITFFTTALVLSIGALALLVLVTAGLLPSFSPSELLALAVAPTGNRWLPNGYTGVVLAIPFALWLFLSIEVGIFSAEDVSEPQRTLPKSLLLSFASLLMIALLVLIILPGSPPGVLAISKLPDPLGPGLHKIFGRSPLVDLLTLAGAIAGFHSMVYASSRLVLAMARAGFMPASLTKVAPASGMPSRAVVVVCLAVFALVFATRFVASEKQVVEVLIHLAAIGGLVSYLFVFAAYLKLHSTYPDLPRPFQSMFGATGAIAGLLMVAIGLLLLLAFGEAATAFGAFASISIAACIIFFIAGLGRTDASAPEEQFAQSLNKPQA